MGEGWRQKKTFPETKGWRLVQSLVCLPLLLWGLLIHDDQGEGAISGWSKKFQSWKDCPGAWAQLSTCNVNRDFCAQSRPYQREVSRPSAQASFFSDYLRWGWVFLERTRILSGIQFTTHFIEILVVETKRFVGSLVHVILTRQTCGQRSSKAAESKRRALGNYFFERIWYMFPISKCRGDWDLGLCTTSGLAYGEPQRNGRIRFFLRRNTFFSREVKEVRVSGW